MDVRGADAAAEEIPTGNNTKEARGREKEAAKRDTLTYAAPVEYGRLAFARFIELYFYAAAALLYVVKVFLENRDVSWLSILTSSGVIIVMVALFFVVFIQSLTGNTPLVAIFRMLEEIYRRFSRISIEGFEVSFEPNPQLAPVRKDEVKSLFAQYLHRSGDAMDTAKRRPNALILAGTVIAFVGLVFFILTLPGSRYGFLDIAPQGTEPKGDFWASAIQLLPRLLMLLFIQVLAGFFLRQYRSSMEEFRYYEAVLRHREAQLLSYSIRDKMSDKRAIMHFADDLLKERDFGGLASGHTTATLEAQRAESNEFLSLYERLAAFITRKEREGQKGRKGENVAGKRKRRGLPQKQ